jgi:glycosyltransferase involved in cell wall biosynthesis
VKECALALAQAGHDVHVFVPPLAADVGAEAAPLAIHEVAGIVESVSSGEILPSLSAIIFQGGQAVYRLALAWRLSEALLAEHSVKPFDIVDAPEVEALGLPLLLRGDFHVPVVTQLHCCTALARRANGIEADAEGGLIDAMEQAAIHLADGVVAPSENLARLTADLSTTSREIRVVPHPFGVSGKAFSPPTAGGPIVFVGRLERLKGVEAIVEALNLFLPNHPEATFRFIGADTSAGPQASSVQKALLSRLSPGLAPRVHFLGELPMSQLAAEWSRASFGVMPSLVESFSMACCEAMAAGRTVIVGKETGTVELLGPAGVAVDPNSPQELCDAMTELWTRPRHLRALSMAAHHRVLQHLNPGRIADLRCKFYGEVVQGFGGAGQRLAWLASLPPACIAAVLPALSRLVGSLSGSASAAVQTPGSRLLRIMDQLQSQEGQPAKVVLYGAGKHTARLLSERHLWESKGHRVVGIIDDHPRFAEAPYYLDLSVQSVAATHRSLLDQTIPFLPIVLSTDTYQDQFWKQAAPLREAGVPVYRLYP